MKCPVCNIDLLMGERLSVSIDYCPQCRGIWLEKGKLDQLLNGGGIGQHAQVSSGSGGLIDSMLGKYSGNDHDRHHNDHHHHDHEYTEKKHKKRSFLDDLF